jgi:Flp pilus assembly pilin Flp
MESIKTATQVLNRAAEEIIGRLLVSRAAERGQALVEGAMVIGLVAIMAITVVTALGGTVTGPFAEISHVFHGGDQANLPDEGYNGFVGARIAD